MLSIKCNDKKSNKFEIFNAVLYTIEIQKRGLPQAHILILLKDKSKCHDPSQIDDIICSKIPDKDEDPEAYVAVENYMMHVPCGEANTKSPCMVDNKCTKHFPKKNTTQKQQSMKKDFKCTRGERMGNKSKRENYTRQQICRILQQGSPGQIPRSY